MKIRILLSIVLVLAASCAFAATRHTATRLVVKKPVVVVEGVQMPAWVERASGARDALTLGASLNNKDRVLTGAGGARCCGSPTAASSSWARTAYSCSTTSTSRIST